jgi:hypothetical protein
MLALMSHPEGRKGSLENMGVRVGELQALAGKGEKDIWIHGK